MSLEVGERVRVHLNLHRGDFSVADPRTGLVRENVPSIVLRNVEFRVQPAMLHKIRAMGRRKVCAYAVGIIESFDDDGQREHKITFNPFRTGTFVRENGDPIYTADRVLFADRYAFEKGVAVTN